MQDYLFLFFYASNFEEVEGGILLLGCSSVSPSIHPFVTYLKDTFFSVYERGGIHYLHQ